MDHQKYRVLAEPFFFVFPYPRQNTPLLKTPKTQDPTNSPRSANGQAYSIPRLCRSRTIVHLSPVKGWKITGHKVIKDEGLSEDPSPGQPLKFKYKR